jgi:hypothetical protein
MGGNGAESAGEVDRTGNPEGGMNNRPSKNGQRSARGRFQPGNTYGKGRPEGSRNKVSVMLQSLLEEQAQAVTEKVVELAKRGDSTAMRLVIERLIPPTRERRVNLTLPKVTTAADVTGAIGAVLEAVASGELAPGEGQQLAALLEAQRKSIETVQLEERVTALEARRKQ